MVDRPAFCFRVTAMMKVAWEADEGFLKTELLYFMVSHLLVNSGSAPSNGSSKREGEGDWSDCRFGRNFPLLDEAAAGWSIHQC